MILRFLIRKLLTRFLQKIVLTFLKLNLVFLSSLFLKSFSKLSETKNVKTITSSPALNKTMGRQTVQKRTKLLFWRSESTGSVRVLQTCPWDVLEQVVTIIRLDYKLHSINLKKKIKKLKTNEKIAKEKLSLTTWNAQVDGELNWWWEFFWQQKQLVYVYTMALNDVKSLMMNYCANHQIQNKKVRWRNLTLTNKRNVKDEEINQRKPTNFDLTTEKNITKAEELFLANKDKWMKTVFERSMKHIFFCFDQNWKISRKAFVVEVFFLRFNPSGMSISDFA